ncbi:MAG: hypothetical protein HYY93_09680 [Planctomycetes bacterium]|nr:hypothetical protein [Planctomycetota bacterium]
MPPNSRAVTFLQSLFERSGYIRTKRETGHGTSHPGFELRLVVRDRAEERAAKSAMNALGLTPGRSFPKWDRYVIPFYGRRQVERFVETIRPNGKLSVRTFVRGNHARAR